MDTQTTNGEVIQQTADKGIQLPCPLCGEGLANILLSLVDMETCHCEECGNEFTLEDVRDLIEKWQKVIVWIEASPRW